MITLGWVFGAVWMSATSGAPLTRFASSLHCSGFQFGLLSALPFLASLLSMPASLLIDRTGRRKTIFLCGLYLQRRCGCRSPSCRSGCSPIMGLPRRRGDARVPRAHAPDALRRCRRRASVDELDGRRRAGQVYGKYFSRRRQWGILSGIPAALVVGWLLDHHARGPAG